MLQYAHFSYQQRNETTTSDGDDGGDDNDDGDDNDGCGDDDDGDDDDSRLVDHMTTWWDRQLSRLLLYSSYIISYLIQCISTGDLPLHAAAEQVLLDHLTAQLVDVIELMVVLGLTH